MDLTKATQTTIQNEVQLAMVHFIVSRGQTKLGSYYMKLDTLSLVPRPSQPVFVIPTQK